MLVRNVNVASWRIDIVALAFNDLNFVRLMSYVYLTEILGEERFIMLRNHLNLSRPLS